MLLLTVAFLITALLYASVGFAGGSTYNALLALAGLDQQRLVIIALCCNLIVAAGGSWRFHRAGLVPWRRLLPLLAVSVPAAWLGGSLPISKTLFVVLLGGSLALAGLLLLVQPERAVHHDSAQRFDLAGPAIAAPIGFLAGIVGIGGGIFLAPVLHLIGWDRARRIAASASVFIFVNSLGGLAGQLGKAGGGSALLNAVTIYWPLALAVLIGGQVGSRLGSAILSPVILRRLTAALVLYVAARLLWPLWSGG